MAAYFDYLTMDEEYAAFKSEVQKITASTGFITLYMVIVPLGLWLLMKIIGTGETPDYFFCLSVYGYSFSVFLPTILLYMIPSNMVKWALLIGAGLISLYFLAKELFGMIAARLQSQGVKVASGVMIALHLIFVLMLKWRFL